MTKEERAKLAEARELLVEVIQSIDARDLELSDFDVDGNRCAIADRVCVAGVVTLLDWASGP